MRRILHETTADTYEAFLTGTDNFRYKINPNYKANRKDMVRPQWLEDCREYLVTEWKAKLCNGYEADDACGMYQTNDTVIASIDKDLLMISGNHFNFVKGEWREVSDFEGLKHFYKQLLIGDPVDNIFGIDGIGKVKAARIIDPCETEEEMLEQVRSRYDDDERLIMNAKCLWIWRKENDIWEAPFEPEVKSTTDDLPIQE